MGKQQDFYELKAGNVKVRITKVSGMLTANYGGIQPFAIAPWINEELSVDTPNLLKKLQGDFDCWFGINDKPVNKVQYLPHGDPANLEWKLVEQVVQNNNVLSFQLSIDTQTIPGKVDKRIALINGQNVLYTQTINRVDAKLPVGHHAMIKVPDGEYDVTTSTFIYGGTFPGEFTIGGGRPRLQPDREVESLDKLALRNGGFVRLNDYYKIKGHEDLFMVSYNPKEDFAWSAMTNIKDRYVFFTLKDPRVLASTVFWLSHFGRTETPWAKDGKPRHGYVIGIEDVTAFYCFGIAESLGLVDEYRKLFEKLQGIGIKTYLEFNRQNSIPINYIIGVVRVPEGFLGVESIEREKDDLIAIIGKGGYPVIKEKVNWRWLYECW